MTWLIESIFKFSHSAECSSIRNHMTCKLNTCFQSMHIFHANPLAFLCAFTQNTLWLVYADETDGKIKDFMVVTVAQKWQIMFQSCFMSCRIKCLVCNNFLFCFSFVPLSYSFKMQKMLLSFSRAVIDGMFDLRTWRQRWQRTDNMNIS